MKRVESIQDFLSRKVESVLATSDKARQNFYAFRIEDNLHAGVTTPAFIRREFFKIMLFQGENIFHFGDKSIPVSGTTLLFFNPQVPYTYEPLANTTTGYFCVFNDDFFKDSLRLNLAGIPVFTPGTHPVFSLTREASGEFATLFEKILKEHGSDYLYKDELVRSYISEIIYQAMKLQPPDHGVSPADANARITAVFTELLKRQFPIDAVTRRFEFRSPKTFAERLSIHVNHLNRAVKKTTGRTTSDHIFDRMVSEAKALLKHSHWNIAEIGYTLGFENQSQFNSFMKKRTGHNPSALRQV